MANNLTSAETVKILEIFGMPPNGIVLAVTAMFLYPFSNTDIWNGNFYNNGDLTPILNGIKTQITNADQDTANAARECFPIWDVVKFSELKLTSGPTGSGGPALFDASAKQEQIRNYIGNLFGVFCPSGGYRHEAIAVLGRSLADYRKNQGISSR